MESLLVIAGVVWIARWRCQFSAFSITQIIRISPDVNAGQKQEGPDSVRPLLLLKGKANKF
ncbi:MAG: hypothetical protein PVS2B2_08610 [Candidatus Acidiferrum sp.]